MSTFVSYANSQDGTEVIHAATCGKGKQEAGKAGVPLTPAADNLRDVVIESWSDIWSDEYPSTEAAIEAGELEVYAAHHTRVCPCAAKAGFRNSL